MSLVVCAHTHTHTHTYVHMHTCTYVHMHTCTYVHMRMCICTHAHKYMHARIKNAIFYLRTCIGEKVILKILEINDEI